MKNQNIKKFVLPVILLGLSVFFTICVTKFDVQPVGPEASLIGFAAFNMAIHSSVGTDLVVQWGQTLCGITLQTGLDLFLCSLLLVWQFWGCVS